MKTTSLHNGAPKNKINVLPCPRGICLIVNIKHCQFSSTLHGAEYDWRWLTDLFQELHFEVVVRQDLTKDEIWATEREFAERDHSQFDAFLFYILSHGNENDVIIGKHWRAPQCCKTHSLFHASSCQTLKHKPKPFFVEVSRGLSLSRSPPSPGIANPSASAEEPDFLLAYATALGRIAKKD